MLKIVSHDLRNPLSLIISARDMLEYDIGEQPEESIIPKYLEIILQSTERMNTLIEDLLQAETSNQRELDAEKLVKKVVGRVRPMADRKRQTLALDLQMVQPTTFVADPLLIGEALENYLSNAIKYTPKDGRIIVHIYVSHDRLHFVVEDNGVGIAAEYLPHLFEPYYRPPGTTEQGYGVGLNLVKTIVDRHNGQVWVESTPKVGSQFGFWVPLAQ
jgi:signal transduction histidine kinase